MTKPLNKLTVVQTADGRPCIVSGLMHRILTFIADHPGALYDEIGAHVDLHRASVNALASKLDRANLVRRVHASIDGRQRTQTFVREGIVLDFDVVRL